MQCVAIIRLFTYIHVEVHIDIMNYRRNVMNLYWEWRGALVIFNAVDTQSIF